MFKKNNREEKENKKKLKSFSFGKYKTLNKDEYKKKKGGYENIVAGIILFFIFIFVFSYIINMSNGGSNSDKYNSVQNKVKQMSALEKMSIAFIGNYDRPKIKIKMDKAMTFYNLQITEENYSRAGSTLVALRKEYGIEEMKILDYMIKSYVPNVNMSFPDAAAIATVFLVTGNK